MASPPIQGRENHGALPLTEELSLHRKALLIVLALTLAGIVANHGGFLVPWKASGEKKEERDRVIVRGEDGIGRHTTIGIDESTLAVGGESRLLRFSTLVQWKFKRENPPPCPEEIRKLDGRDSQCIGFMYPLEAGKELRHFCLLRTTQTCCYGPRPQWSQYIFVEMAAPTPFERLRPVAVNGTFFVDPNPDDGYIYRMEGKTSRVIEDDVPDVDPVQAATEAGLLLFDFAPLESMRVQDEVESIGEAPAALHALDGKNVVLAGFLVGSTGGERPTVFVGKSWWDGVSQGSPPDLFNAVPVFPCDTGEIPPAWKQNVIFTGLLRLTRDPKDYAQDGIVSLRDAVRGVPGSGKGPAGRGSTADAIWQEAVILAIILAALFVDLALGRSRSA